MYTVLVFISVIAAFIVAVTLFMRLPRFGALPSGERLERIKRSQNYIEGKFHNQSHTPDFTDGGTFLKVSYNFLFRKYPRLKPEAPLSTEHHDLRHPDRSRNILVWLGHSSYYLQADGIRVLVDPVFSGAASPVAFTTRSFEGTNAYSADDFPDPDVLLLTHDHWDHLDHTSVLLMAPRSKKIITSLGVGAHLERWKIAKDKIIEMDWWESYIPFEGLTITCCPARHFSGRGFTRAKTLWGSFALRFSTVNIFAGADSGYDHHFKRIGEELGPFDLALLECGQYNRYWKHIHMMPEELYDAGTDLRAKHVMPVHWGRFALAMHPWDEPIRRFMIRYEHDAITPVTPRIGAILDLSQLDRPFEHWWKEQVFKS